MRSKTIYLIRHGETDFNRKGIVQGSGIDADLNEFGRAQAEAFFDTYAHVPFKRIYTSKLKRTIQSVQQFIEQGVPCESFSGLNEICWGVYEGQTTFSMNGDYFKELSLAWKAGETGLAIEGGESPLEVLQRQEPVIETILSRPEESTILIAMHGRAIRILLTHLLKKPLSDMDTFSHSNLGLYKLTYSYESNSFSVEAANDITHLLAIEIPHN